MSARARVGLVLLLAAMAAAGLRCAGTCAIPGGPVVPCAWSGCGTCGEAGCICPQGQL